MDFQQPHVNYYKESCVHCEGPLNKANIDGSL